jgi:hypothetical protein
MFHLFLGIRTNQAKITYKFTISHMLKIPLYHTSFITPLNPSGYFLYHQAPHKNKMTSCPRNILCPAYDYFNLNKSTNWMQQFLLFIILTFIYSSTCFERPHAHHQELNNCSNSLWFYLRIVVIAVLLVVVGLVRTPETC